MPAWKAGTRSIGPPPAGAGGAAAGQPNLVGTSMAVATASRRVPRAGRPRGLVPSPIFFASDERCLA